MKIIFYAAALMLLSLSVGCTAKLANRELGPEEKEWKEYLEPMYPGWKTPGTLPPAISDRYNRNNNAAPATDGTLDFAGDTAEVSTADKNTSLAADASTPSAIVVRYEDYTVEKNDTLSHIAKKVYGNGRKYYRIYEANKDIIKNQNKIYPGMTLKIPRP